MINLPVPDPYPESVYGDIHLVVGRGNTPIGATNVKDIVDLYDSNPVLRKWVPRVGPASVRWEAEYGVLTGDGEWLPVVYEFPTPNPDPWADLYPRPQDMIWEYNTVPDPKFMAEYLAGFPEAYEKVWNNVREMMRTLSPFGTLAVCRGVSLPVVEEYIYKWTVNSRTDGKVSKEGYLYATIHTGWVRYDSPIREDGTVFVVVGWRWKWELITNDMDRQSLERMCRNLTNRLGRLVQPCPKEICDGFEKYMLGVLASLTAKIQDARARTDALLKDIPPVVPKREWEIKVGHKFRLPLFLEYHWPLDPRKEANLFRLGYGLYYAYGHRNSYVARYRRRPVDDEERYAVLRSLWGTVRVEREGNLWLLYTEHPGWVIGKKGWAIKALQEEIGAPIKVIEDGRRRPSPLGDRRNAPSHLLFL